MTFGLPNINHVIVILSYFKYFFNTFILNRKITIDKINNYDILIKMPEIIMNIKNKKNIKMKKGAIHVKVFYFQKYIK